jgi:hypothetical protein
MKLSDQISLAELCRVRLSLSECSIIREGVRLGLIGPGESRLISGLLAVLRERKKIRDKRNREVRRWR